jgi:hypothetical protein
MRRFSGGEGALEEGWKRGMTLEGGAPRFLDSVDRLFLWSSFRGEARQEVEGSLIPEG